MEANYDTEVSSKQGTLVLVSNFLDFTSCLDYPFTYLSAVSLQGVIVSRKTIYGEHIMFVLSIRLSMRIALFLM